MDPNINSTDGIINIILIGDNNIAILRKIFQYYKWLGKQPVESTDDSSYTNIKVNNLYFWISSPDSGVYKDLLAITKAIFYCNAKSDIKNCIESVRDESGCIAIEINANDDIGNCLNSIEFLLKNNQDVHELEYKNDLLFFGGRYDQKSNISLLPTEVINQIRLSHQGLHSNSIFRIGPSEPEYDISPMHTTGCPIQ